MNTAVDIKSNPVGMLTLFGTSYSERLKQQHSHIVPLAMLNVKITSVWRTVKTQENKFGSYAFLVKCTNACQAVI